MDEERYPKNPEYWTLVVSRVKQRQQRVGLVRWIRNFVLIMSAVVGTLFGIFITLFNLYEQTQWRKHG